MSKSARFPDAMRRRLGGLGLLWLLAALAVAWGLAFQSPFVGATSVPQLIYCKT